MRSRNSLHTGAIEDEPVVVDEVLAVLAGLEQQGRLLEAIDVASRAAQRRRAGELEESLLRLRHLAGAEAGGSVSASGVWPPDVPDLFRKREDQLAEVQPSELTAESLASGIAHHGSLLVRGLVPPERVEQLAQDIDQAIAGYESWASGAEPESTRPWFVPFVPEVEDGNPFSHWRRVVRMADSLLAVDSPRAMFDLCDVFNRTGIARVVEEYLGERPVLSARKCMLRRVPPELSGSEWHQDGQFLDRGTGLRTVNAWIALSNCGVDKPGLDVVSGRVSEILETGTHGARFEWTVGPRLVEELEAERCLVVTRPEFAPGDVLFFDELNLHRTGLGEWMTRPRYAVESWFFAPSLCPNQHTPILV